MVIQFSPENSQSGQEEKAEGLEGVSGRVG